MLKLLPASSATHKGHRDYQEDRLFISTYEQGTLLAVFDGHGGAAVSHLASEQFPLLFANEINEDGASDHVPEVLASVIQKVHLLTQHMVEEGSTVSLAFISADKPVVYCAVLGDSPILIKDKAGKINVSPEHNVRTNQEEAQAARARGGFVNGYYLFQTYDGMGLQMTRALGDAHLNQVLSRIPDIYQVEVGPKSWVLVASDGLFDPSHAQFKQVAQTISEMVEDRGADAAALVHYAAVDYPTGDNVSCILVKFKADDDDRDSMPTLTTTIKRQWLAEIIAGTKKTEYRARKPYWHDRLSGRETPFKLRLINGMSKTAPEVTVLISDVSLSPTDYLLHISKIISYKNWDKKRGIPA